MNNSDSRLVLPCGHAKSDSFELNEQIFCQICHAPIFERLIQYREEEIKKKVAKGEDIYWKGSNPEKCDLCSGPFTDKVFYDTHLPHQTRWGLFCYSCFTAMRCSTGTGMGQKYDLETKRKLEG